MIETRLNRLKTLFNVEDLCFQAYCLFKRTQVPVKKQFVFTSVDKNLIKEVKSFYLDNDISLSNPALNQIVAAYLEEIKEKFPELPYNDEPYFGSDTIFIQFQFIIQPYDSDLHPPHDMNILKPITIIDDHVFNPAVEIPFKPPLKQPAIVIN